MIKKIIFVLIMIVHISSISSQVCQKWVFGYIPTYTQGVGGFPFLSAAEYQKLTHIGHLGPYVNQDGSLNMVSNGASLHKLSTGVAAAHSNGVPILLSFQAWYTDYMPALSTPATRATLINSVLNLLDTYNYDGVDVDLEPIMSPWVAGMQTGNPNYVTFVNTLYDSLQTRTCSFTNKKPLLAVAANGYAGPVLYQLQNKFDMINLLTYDLAGVFPGWVPWHDSAVYDGGNTMPSTGQPMSSVHGEVTLCTDAGVSLGKLGVGISFDAFRWQGGEGTATGGVTAPMQRYTVDPTWTRFSYSDFITNYYSSSYYEYDYDAKMSYLSIDRLGSANDEFWSYNDQYSCIDKVDYVWEKGLGGSMIWELNSGYLSNNPSGSKIPQLNFIYDENCLKAGALAIDDIVILRCESTGQYDNLTWNSDYSPEIKEYKLYSSENGIDWKEITTISPIDTKDKYSYKAFNELNSRKYYQIEVSSFEGSFTYSNIVKTFENDDFEILIYPNPVKDIIYVQGKSNQLYDFSLYDVNGKVVAQKLQNETFDISHLEAGLYYLKIIFDNHINHVKVIKI